MAYAFEPADALQAEVRRVADERLGDAIARLDAVLAGDDPDIERAVHETRKRCKELRGLARLIRPAIGTDFRDFDRTIRAAANELSAMRDASALLGTLDALLAAAPVDDAALREVRDHQARLAETATASAAARDDRIERARSLLRGARASARQWALAPGFDAAAAGLTTTYRRGRRDLERCRTRPSDRRFHEWRKSVKYLWYQLRLLRNASPSVLEPMIAQLDGLAEALGDDHDLAVLVEQLDREPSRFGDSDAVAQVRALARAQQERLRDTAVRAGAVVYAETPAASVERVTAYWTLAIEQGREGPTGGIAALQASVVAEDHGAPTRDPQPASADPFERERKFLVDRPPTVLGNGTELRQGYLAIGERASVRVRDGGDCTLTVKAGRGAERVELEWPIDRAAFDAAWPHTEGARVSKTRYRLDLGDHVVEVDVFADRLDGLVLAEVEFASLAELEAFEPPDWFGPEVTDDGRYTNASLAVDGLPT